MKSPLPPAGWLKVFFAFTFSLACTVALAYTDFVYLGQQIIPHNLDFKGTTVGGLSAIDYDPRTQNYYVLSDARSHARFYTLKLELDKFERTEEAGMEGVHIEAVHELRNAAGQPYRDNFVDPEGMRFNPSTHTLYWSDEGRRSGYLFLRPAVSEIDQEGNYLREFAVPDYYQPSGSISGRAPGDMGVYDNLAFESVALSPDRKTLWTATENGLTQDSQTATVNHGSLSRLLGFDVGSGRPIHEYAYEVAPVVNPPIFPHLLAVNGLADMLAIGDKQFITLERSYAMGAATPGKRRSGMTIRLFYADAREATEVLGFPSLAGKEIRKVEKTLLLDLSKLINDDGTPLSVDNLEGITVGPCHQGKPTLILVADNNFRMLQITQLIALSVHDPLLLPLLKNACRASR